MLQQIDVDIIEQIINAFIEAVDSGNTIFVLGNGGSASIASHFADDLILGARAKGVKPIRALSLTDNPAILTTIANDECYENIFIRQLEIMAVEGDVVVALSVSGNSANVLEAVRYSKETGILTIGVTGFDGGELRKLADISLYIPTSQGEYGPVEDIFMILNHLIYTYLRIERRGKL